MSEESPWPFEDSSRSNGLRDLKIRHWALKMTLSRSEKCQ